MHLSSVSHVVNFLVRLVLNDPIENSFSMFANMSLANNAWQVMSACFLSQIAGSVRRRLSLDRVP